MVPPLVRIAEASEQQSKVPCSSAHSTTQTNPSEASSARQVRCSFGPDHVAASGVLHHDLRQARFGSNCGTALVRWERRHGPVRWEDQ